ncbi:cytochrome P450 2F2-like [Leptodactylus fuscus]|uniref:cytochrome P450 2F2-like n=1 Tax=Leptodactylus fuscus TaxID=238119 RepID=UPI003F4E8A63
MPDADSINILLVIFTFCLLCKFFYDQHKSKHKNFPPGPMWLPIIGNLHLFNLRNPYETMTQLSKKYGSIFSFQMGSEKVVVLCGYEAVKDALLQHGNDFSNRPQIPLIAALTRGYGVVFAKDENWNVMRRFTFITLRQLGVGSKAMESVINEECDMLLEAIKSYEGKPFDNLPLLSTTIANILVSIILGNQYSCKDPRVQRLKHLIEESVKLIACPMSLCYNAFPSLLDWLPGSHKTTFSNNLEMYKIVKEFSMILREQLDKNEQRSLLDAFLVKQHEIKSKSGLYFHDENLKTLVSNMLIAGMEPVHSTLRWGLLLMMKYPDIQKNVQNEIEKVIGLSQPQIEHRKDMPYTNAVIHEIQRFGNIAPISIPHTTTRDINFRGYFLPKDTFIIMLLKSVLQDKEYFEKPEEFYPQHFLDSEGKFVMNEAFIPFSAGKRSCIGENLAKVELFLVFTRLLQTFTFLPCPGVDLDFNPEIGFVSSPKPYMMRAVPQSYTILSEQQCVFLDSTFTLEELLEALVGMVKGKSPGPDGIPVEVYVRYRDHLLPELLNCYNVAFAGLLASFYDASIILLLKPDRHLLDCGSCRPISLLNEDYNLLTKFLANRLISVILDLIHTDRFHARKVYIGQSKTGSGDNSNWGLLLS